MEDGGLALRLHQVVWLMDRRADEVLRREYGISLSWGRLLIVLAQSAPVVQHELAQRLNHSDAAISRQLERMSASGLLTVNTDPTHRRKRLVGLTPLGRTMVDAASAELETLLRDDMTQAGLDIEGFTKSITALARQLAVPPPPPPPPPPQPSTPGRLRSRGPIEGTVL